MTPIVADSITTGLARMQALEDYKNTPANVDAIPAAMEWKEGLAAGSAAFTSAWATSGGTSLTTDDGTTTASRAAEQGTATGLLTETAYFYTTYTIDPVDLTRLVITNDGSSNYVADALFGVDAVYLGTYTTIGMSIFITDGCTMEVAGPTACEVAFDVVVAEAYTNAADVPECSTTVSYGGGDCDPDAEGQAVYEAINEMRAQMAAWIPLIDLAAAGADLAITCAANNIVCTATYDGTTSAERTFVRTVTNIQAAADAMTAAGTLEVLAWQPGLYFAAKDQATYLETADSLTTVG